MPPPDPKRPTPEGLTPKRPTPERLTSTGDSPAGSVSSAAPDLRVAPRLGGPERAAPFAFTLDGATFHAHPGETIGAALLAGGVRHLRTTRGQGRPRGLYCGIGACFDCLVTVNGTPSQRACLTPAAPGDRVEVQDVPHLD